MTCSIDTGRPQRVGCGLLRFRHRVGNNRHGSPTKQGGPSRVTAGGRRALAGPQYECEAVDVNFSECSLRPLLGDSLMRTRTLTIAAILFLGTLTSCNIGENAFAPTASVAGVSPGQTGSADVTLTVGRIGILSKAAASASIALCSLRVNLTASGEAPVNWATPISGTGALTVVHSFSGLAAKVWLLSAETRDTRNVPIHAGLSSFSVLRKSTVSVNVPLAPKYSMIVAKFFPVRDSVNRCILIIDGTTRGDSTFAKQSHVGDTIPLGYDYLTTGATHSISMRARGAMWGIDTLLYSGDTSVTVVPGVSAAFRVTLRWVGPANPPPGQANMVVTMGTLGTVTIEGRIGG